MKNVVKEIVLEVDQIKNLEKAFYEYDMFKDQVAFIIDQNSSNTDFFNSSTYKMLHDKEMEIYKQYLDAKNFITLTYIPDEFKNDKYTWQADFINSKLLITE